MMEFYNEELATNTTNTQFQIRIFLKNISRDQIKYILCVYILPMWHSNFKKSNTFLKLTKGAFLRFLVKFIMMINNYSRIKIQNMIFHSIPDKHPKFTSELFRKLRFLFTIIKLRHRHQNEPTPLIPPTTLAEAKIGRAHV